MGVLDAGIGSQPARRRHDVGGIADEEDPPDTVLLRHLGADGETEHLQVGAGNLGPQRDRDVGQPSRLPDQLDHPLLREIGQGLAVLGRKTGAKDPALSGLVVSHQDRAGAGLLQVGDIDPAPAQGRSQIGIDQRGDDVEERSRTVQTDAELLPDRAVPAVGGNEVVRPHRPLGSRPPVLQRSR